MITNLLFSLGWLWSDMTKTPSHVALTTAFFLIVLLCILLNNNEYTSSSISIFLNGFLLIAIGCCEVYGHVAHHGDPTWILSSFGNFFFGMCVLFVAFLVMISQYHLTKGVLNGLSYAGDFENKYGSGFTSVIVAAIASVIASFFGGEATMIVGILFSCIPTLCSWINHILGYKQQWQYFICTILNLYISGRSCWYCISLCPFFVTCYNCSYTNGYR